MPGIIVASWKRDRAEKAKKLFERACERYTHFKGLECKSSVVGPDYGIARLPQRKSPCPDIYRTEDDRLILAAGGWWYDPEASESDKPSLENLAQCYGRDRDKALHRLEGQFLIIVHSREEGTLTAWGDPLGMFAFYVAESDGIAWCSTSALALAATLGSQLDPAAIRGLFMDGAIRSPYSAFEGLKRPGIGEQVSMADGRLRISRVWSPYRQPRKYRNVEDAAEEGLSLMQRSCRHIHKIWPRCISDLTSGLDSRLVVAVTASQGLPIQATVSGDESNFDVVMARLISKHFNWPLKHFSEPSDWGRQRWKLFKQAVALGEGELQGSKLDKTIRVKLDVADSFDAALSGGGGGFYRDFFWQQEFLKVGKTSKLDISRVFRFRFFFSSRPKMSLFRNDWRPDYMDRQTEIARQLLDLEPDALNTAKLDTLLLWKVSGSLAPYLRALNPLIASPLLFLNRGLFEYLVSVPWRYRVGALLERQIITLAHPELAAMPTWYGGSAEPMRITRPLNYLPYAIEGFKKLVRKFGQLTIKRPIFRDPCARKQNPLVDKDFVSVLDSEGFLDIDNLRTAELYDADGLRTFLTNARGNGFHSFGQLYTIITVELLARICKLTPKEQVL